MILERGEPTHLGSSAKRAVISFRQAPGIQKGWMGRRELAIRGEAAFELSYWCGTCAFLFEKLDPDLQKVDFAAFSERLEGGLNHIDRDVVKAVGPLLEKGMYLPLLIRVTPTLVTANSDQDYFAHEQVGTWGESPMSKERSEYYRTFAAPISDEDHLYEFVVPLVPPSWNDDVTMAAIEEDLHSGAVPTAIAVSILDVSTPETVEGMNWYSHWGLTHFLIDGHHKVAAAAATGKPITILSLLALGSGISNQDEVEAALKVRATSAPAARAPIL